eukprot:COSAG05_NODE_923_length_6573_cov_168.011725_4_plen_207_part_00
MRVIVLFDARIGAVGPSEPGNSGLDRLLQERRRGPVSHQLRWLEQVQGEPPTYGYIDDARRAGSALGSGVLPGWTVGRRVERAPALRGCQCFPPFPTPAPNSDMSGPERRQFPKLYGKPRSSCRKHGTAKRNLNHVPAVYLDDETLGEKGEEVPAADTKLLADIRGLDRAVEVEPNLRCRGGGGFDDDSLAVSGADLRVQLTTKIR